MRSRMTPEQLTQLKNRAEQSNADRALAQAANGHGVSRLDAAKAQRELVERLGERGAKRAQEAEIQSAGGRAKGLRRFIG